MPSAKTRHEDRFDELARRAVLLAVGEEEILQRDLPPLGPAPQRQPRVERDQRRRQVADRRAVGDVAADRAGVADLDGGEAAHQLAEIGMEPGERRGGVAMA